MSDTEMLLETFQPFVKIRYFWNSSFTQSFMFQKINIKKFKYIDITFENSSHNGSFDYLTVGTHLYLICLNIFFIL